MDCFVNKQGRLTDIPQVSREPFEGEHKVSLNGYYEVLNEQRYQEAEYNFTAERWVGVGEPIIPQPQPPSEVEVLKEQLALQNQMVSDLMELLFTRVPELNTI